MKIDEHQLRRVADVTRRYAEFSKDAAGLVTLWGVLLLIFLTGLVWGQGLRLWEGATAAGSTDGILLHFLRRSHPSPVWMQITFMLTPLVWFLGWRLLRHWSLRRFGRVEEELNPRKKADRLLLILTLFALPLGFAQYVCLVSWISGSPFSGLPFWGGLALPVLGSLLAFLGRKELGEEGLATLGMLVLLSAILVFRGLGSSLVLLLPFYFLLALANFVRGTIRWVGFQKVSRELESLGGDHGEA